MTLNEKMLKLRYFIMGNTNNLFGTDWMEQFMSWNSPISSFCQEIKGFYPQSRKFKKIKN